MKRFRPLALACATALCALTTGACSSTPAPAEPTAPPPPAPTPTAGQGGAAPTPLPFPNGSTSGSGGAAPASPIAETPATPIPPLLASNAAPMLRGLAQSKLRGMTPDGSPLAGQFAPGQVLEQTFNLQPGRCYAVVGVGIGITELDVEIILHQPPAPAYSAAKDDTTGPQAVLGGRRDCFRSPLPFAAPAKVKLKASSGAGVGVAQLFIR